MSRLVLAGEHTIDADRLTGGWVLDAGCRDFAFSRQMAELGCRVIALDADPTVEDPLLGGIRFYNFALDAETGEREIVMTADPQARHFAGLYTGSPAVERRRVQAVTVLQMMRSLGIDCWDVVKLDIEGAEYEILRRWSGPIARQISVEFHEHCAQRPPELYAEIFQHLGSWYDVVQHEKEARHCLPPNWFDTLLVLR